MTPSEPSLEKTLISVRDKLLQDNITLEFRKNTQFLITHDAFIIQYDKPPVMETFYRRMRKRFDIMMIEGKPEGGERNYDKDNRKFDKNYIPRGEKIVYPISRKHALDILQDFIEHKLDRFGELEDAMYS